MGIFKKKDKTEAAAAFSTDAAEALSEKLMKSVRLFKLDKLIPPILTIILGILFLIWPDISLSVVARVVGAVLAISGVCAAVYYFRSNDRLLLQSSILCIGMINIVVGIWILISPDFMIALMPKLIGLMLLVNGITTFTAAVTLARSNYSKWWITLILSILIFAGGILFLVRPFDVAQIFMRIAGGCMIYAGAANLYIYFIIKRAIKDIGKQFDAAATMVQQAMQEQQAKADSLHAEEPQSGTDF